MRGDPLDLLYAHHPATARHSARVALLMALLGGPDYFAPGLCHDLGKLCVPRDILDAPRALAPEEWGLVKRHPQEGARLQRRAPGLHRAIARAHHERWDGRGYPRGLHAGAIPPAARLCAVCDSYDAMTSPERTYRAPLSIAAALAELERGRGTQFDPGVLDLVLPRLRALAHAYNVTGVPAGVLSAGAV